MTALALAMALFFAGASGAAFWCGAPALGLLIGSAAVAFLILACAIRLNDWTRGGRQ